MVAADTERAALGVLRRDGLRLEQERIPIGAAVDQLMLPAGPGGLVGGG